MRFSILTGTAALCLLSLSAQAQQAPAGGTVVTSEPGKVAMAGAVQASAVVTAIDKASRTVTLKTADRGSFDVVAGDEVRNFDRIKIGDEVVVQYMQALSLEVKKHSGPAKRTDKADAVRAQPGAQPGAAAARQVTVIADVTDVNPKNKTITLKGPKGNVVVLNVKNPDHFKVVKKGDQVEAVYTEAVAISVEPAAKSAAKK